MQNYIIFQYRYRYRTNFNINVVAIKKCLIATTVKRVNLSERKLHSLFAFDWITRHRIGRNGGIMLYCSVRKQKRMT